MLESLFGVLILVGDIYAILQTLQTGESNGTKAVWIAAIIVLPVLGLILWWFAGPKPASG